MNKPIILEELSNAEKIQLMEELWDNISKPAEKYTPPEWHEDELEKRAKAIEEGRTSFTDWRKAKEEIRNNLK